MFNPCAGHLVSPYLLVTQVLQFGKILSNNLVENFPVFLSLIFGAASAEVPDLLIFLSFPFQFSLRSLISKRTFCSIFLFYLADRFLVLLPCSLKTGVCLFYCCSFFYGLYFLYIAFYGLFVLVSIFHVRGFPQITDYPWFFIHKNQRPTGSSATLAICWGSSLHPFRLFYSFLLDCSDFPKKFHNLQPKDEKASYLKFGSGVVAKG